jgi:hypothetical protein
MAARRKWRIVYPGSRNPDRFPSEAKMHEFVDSLRSAWACGAAISSLTVQVNEGDGWVPYEHIDFATEGRRWQTRSAI